MRYCALRPLKPSGRSVSAKLGFATPEYYWLNTLKDNFRDYFTNDLNDYFKIDAIKTDWDSIFNSQERCGITNFWRFINFAIWKKVYGV